MKTEIITIESNGTGIEKALELTNKTGAFCGLDKKSTLRLRLLSEEVIEFISSFTNNLHGDFWLETKDNEVRVHLKTNIPMDIQTRNEILSVSSTGENSAAKGMIGKIREMIAVSSLPDDPETRVMTDQALGLMATGIQMGSHVGSYSWTMSSYVASVNDSYEEDIEAQTAHDDLEKSIVANLADDITVHIVGSDVEITIYKNFS